MRSNPQSEQWFACPSFNRAFVTCCLILLCLVLPVGCNQSASEEELGEIHYSLPKIPGAEQPQKLPPPLTRKPKPKTDAEATAADPPAENQEQLSTQPESTSEEDAPEPASE